MQLAMSFVVCALATHRLGSLLANDDGPADMIKGTRENLEKWGEWYSVAQFAADLMGCIRCNSIWIGAGFGLLWAHYNELPWLAGLIAGLGFSTVAIWIDKEIP